MDRQSERDFLEFVGASSRMLFRTAYALTGHQQRAEDLVQIALTRTASRWRHIQSVPEAYARKIVYNEYLSWWRRRQWKETTMAQMPEQPVAGGESDLLDQMTVRAALDLLAPRQRAVIILRYLEDLSEQDVAEILGCSPSTVGSTTSRALAKLRRHAAYLNANDAQEVSR